MALLADLCLGNILYSLFPDFFNRLYPYPFLEEQGFLLETLEAIAIPTFFIRFYSTLILGVSIGQWVSGIGVRGNFYHSRLAGGIRVFLEPFALPTILPQLPLLAGRRTLGEFLSGTRLQMEDKSLIFPTLFRILALLILSLLAPVLQSFLLTPQVSVSFSHRHIKRNVAGEEIPLRVYASNRFRVKTSSNLAQGGFVFIPDFELVKRGKKTKIKPFLTIFNRYSKGVGQLKRGKKVDLLAILQKGPRGNPLFRYYYPDLYRVFENRGPASVPPSGPVKEQMDLLVGDSFKTGLAKMWVHLITKGPFTGSYMAIRNGLINLVDGEIWPVLSFSSLGDQRFLHFKQFYTHGEGFLLESIIPLGTYSGPMFQFTWREEGDMGRKKFMDSFFAHSKWNFDSKKAIPFPANKEDITPLTVVDYFTEENLPPQQREELVNYLAQHSEALVSRAEGDKKFKALLVDIFDRYLFVAKLGSLGIEKSFRQKITSLKRKLEA